MAGKKPSPEPIGVLRGHGVAVNGVGFLSASSVVSGGAGGGVKLWDLKSRRERAANGTAHSKAGVLHTCVLPVSGASAPRFVTQGRDGFVRVWDASTLAEGCAPLSEFYCGSFSFTKAATLRWPDAGDGEASTALGQLIVAPNSDSDKASTRRSVGVLLVMMLTALVALQVLVYDCRVRSASPAMVLAASDPEKKKGMCMALSLFRASSDVGNGQASGDDAHAFVAVGWEGGQLSLVDLRTPSKVAVERAISKPTHPLLSFDVTRDGSNFILGSAGEDLFHSTFDVTALELGTPRTFFTCNRGGFSTVRIRSDQRILATAGWDHRVRIFHTRKLQPLAILKYHTESVFGLDFSPDNSLLASVSKDRKLALWPIYPPSRDAAREVLRVY